MIKRKIREINMSIKSKKFAFKTNYINSLSKSNVSTSNFSNINPDKNTKTIESYEDFTNKFIPNINGISTKKFILNSHQNKINSNNCITEFRCEDINTIHNNPNKNFIYIKKRQKNYNNIRFNIIKNENSILLNDYRKRIMKLFLASFKPYYFIFLRKHFFSFIRNITYLIMKKELFYKTNAKLKTKNLKINKLNNIQLSKSYENIQLSNKNNNDNNNKGTPLDKSTKCLRLNTLTKRNMDRKNFRYDFFNTNIDNNNNIEKSPKIHCSSILRNSINTLDRVYEFRNIFISSNNTQNRYINTINNSKENKKKHKCFIKKIKDIITPDKRIYIRINYIYLIPKRKIKNISEKQLNYINNSLSITQIYSYEYLSNKLSKIEKINIIVEILNNIIIFKEKKFFLYILKTIKFMNCVEKIIKIIILNKLGRRKKEIKISNDIFLLDDKMVINLDNFNN